MPEAHFTTVTVCHVNAVKGEFTIVGADENGQPVTATLPLSAAARLSAEASRGLSVQRRFAAGHLAKRGDWAEVAPIDVRTVDVGSLVMETPPSVALVLDRGFETELAFRLTTESAQETGQRLIAESERCTTPSTSSRN